MAGLGIRTYYYADTAKSSQGGPLSIQGLQRLWSIGTIDKDTSCWYEGLAEWAPLFHIEELRAKFCPAVAAPAVAAAAPAVPAAADTRYTTENGFSTFTSDSGERFVWDEARSEWLPEEQAKYMLNFDGVEAAIVAPETTEQIEKKLAATDEPDPVLTYGAPLEDPKGKGKGKGKKGTPAKKGWKVDVSADSGAPPEGEEADPDAVNEKGRTEAQEDKRIEKKKEYRKKRKETQWTEAKVNTNIYVEGLPVDIPVEEVVTYFEKCGVIRCDALTNEPVVKFYLDKTTQERKGDARISYLKDESVDLACEMLDASEIRPKYKIRVVPATFELKGEAFVKKAKVVLSEEEKKRSQLKKKEMQGRLSWNDGADSGDGKGLRIVIWKNVFHPDDAKADYNYYDELYEECEREAKKFGELEKVHIFQKNVLGVVSVRFKESAAAAMCIEGMNSKKMAGRVVTVEYFDGVTDHRVKDTDELEQQRIAEFGSWLEGDDQANPNKI